MADLGPLLAPRSVAVVGATSRPGAYADETLRNLKRMGFAGRVWGVHPTRERVHGRVCVPSVADLPEAVDAVVVAIPAAGVPEVIEQAGARGRPLDLVVDVRPHRIELDEPLEQRRLLSQPPRRPLIQVVVAVDEPRRREHAAPVDTPRVRRLRSRAVADGDDAIPVDDDVPIAVFGAGRVDGGDRAAFDDGGHANRSAARRTASRIFS